MRIDLSSSSGDAAPEGGSLSSSKDRLGVFVNDCNGVGANAFACAVSTRRRMASFDIGQVDNIFIFE